MDVYAPDNTHLRQRRYDQFVTNSPQGTLFATSWWLNTVVPDNHHILTIEKGGEIQAAWPFVMDWDKWSGPVISIPPLTPWLGVLYAPVETSKMSTRLTREKDLSTGLIEQLPAFGSLVAMCHRNFTYWSPFFWKDFSQATRYTYVLDNISDIESIWKGLRENVRTDIRKAKKQGIRVETTEDIDRLRRMQALTFQRQKRTMPYPRDLICRVDESCRTRHVRKIFIASDQEGRDHAGAYIVWDNKSTYYLMGGGDPALRSSGATSLVVWEAIQFASTVSNVFDFEGSMIEPIERLFRAFGGTPYPYFSLSKTNSPVTATIQATRDIKKSLRKMFRKHHER